jgi:phosphocarrier protein FPr
MPNPHVLVLRAPLSGQLVPLDQVPDPVFARGLAGQGLAILPSSATLLAPCDGRVAHVHAAGHALVLVTSDGIEVMTHVGLDTVRLDGRGFSPRVRAGESVTCGLPLVEFDADYVGARVPSLLTTLLVAPKARIAGVRPGSGLVVAGVDPVLEVDVLPGVPSPDATADGLVVSEAIHVSAAPGLHARPAAVLAEAAACFDARVWVEREGIRADGRSVIALVALDAGPGATVRLVARGPDAQRAIANLTPVLAWALGHRQGAHADRPAPAGTPGTGPPADRDHGTSESPSRVLGGVGASPGLAVGRTLRFRRSEIGPSEGAPDPEARRSRLTAAIGRARAELRQLSARTRETTAPHTAAIFDVQLLLLGDPALLDTAGAGIAAGVSAETAWTQAIAHHASRLAALRQPVLAARESDLRDVGRRVLRALRADRDWRADVPEATVLIVDEVTPSELASLDRDRVVGVVSTGGSASSHSAVLARGLDVPLVAAIDQRVLGLADGTVAILDGTAGTLCLDPTREELASALDKQGRLRASRAEELAHASAPAVTLDGHRVSVTASIGSLAEAERVVAAGGDGVGLLRSEFLFIGRLEPPGEDEQADLYGRIAAALGPDRPLVVRTLDAGGDKPLAYLLPAHGEHGGFGDRGIRLSLAHPTLFRTQLRAVLRASSLGRVRVMFPLIAQVEEWRAATAMLEQERAQLGVARVEVGITVEVPSAALMADGFAREADFLSIGTNDLAQFTLAVDRGRALSASRGDALDPAVLRLVANTVDAAHRHGRPAGVCGLAAMDPQAIPLFVGLGLDELSVSVPAIPAVKAQVRTLDCRRCRDLAVRALDCRSADEVRAMVARGQR